MKKLMIAAAIVCAAAFAQAASVNWQIGYIEGAGAGGKGWSGEAMNGAGITAELIVGASFTDGVIGDLVTFDDATATGAEEGYMFGYSTATSTMALDTPYYAQVILKDGDSTLASKVVSIEASTMMGGEATPVLAFASEMMGFTEVPGQTLDATYGTFGAEGWQSVPEPTSGLLLLIGVAGLALRRRRA